MVEKEDSRVSRGIHAKREGGPGEKSVRERSLQDQHRGEISVLKGCVYSQTSGLGACLHLKRGEEK